MLNVTDNITNYCSLPWLQQWWELLDTNWDLLPLIVVVKRKMCHIPADGYCRFACQTSWCVSMSVSVCVYVTTKRSFIWLWVAPSAPSDHGGRNFTCASSSLATRSRLPTGPAFCSAVATVHEVQRRPPTLGRYSADREAVFLLLHQPLAWKTGKMI